MTTARTFAVWEGDFGPWGRPWLATMDWSRARRCGRCGSALAIRWRIWYSHDGAYEDSQYECLACGRTWWIDGIDS